MHPIAWKWVAKHTPEMPGRVIEIGGRDVSGGGLQSLLVYATSYLSVDINDGPGVDVVMDFCSWAKTQPDGIADLVISCEVFEHTSSWQAMVGESARLLAPGGMFIMTCATEPRKPHSAIGEPFVPDGEWYKNVHPADAAASMEACFTAYTIDVPGNGDLRVVAFK